MSLNNLDARLKLSKAKKTNNNAFALLIYKRAALCIF